MSMRFLLAFLGFLMVVGGGGLWLAWNIQKRKKLLKNLLSLPKGRRFFWYQLRKSKFIISDMNRVADFSFSVDGISKSYSLKADFIAKLGRKKYACLVSTDLFDSGDEQKEFLKLYFVYSAIFNADGIVFYNENFKEFSVWE